MIYRVNILFDKQCYNLIETRNENLRRNSQELFIKEKRPRLMLSLAVVARLENPATWLLVFFSYHFECFFFLEFYDGTMFINFFVVLDNLRLND